MRTNTRFKALLTTVLLLVTTPALADEVLVAVASNFIKPMQAISQAFTEQTGHQVKLSFGSSGKLMAQTRHGAPYEVFLSADKDKVTRLLNAKLAVAGTDFIYAKGRLVLWSKQADLIGAEHQGAAILRAGHFRHLAIADAKLAPYGKAARQVLDKLQLQAQLEPRVVEGENISQTYQFVRTGNAEIGFVALSQIQHTDAIPHTTSMPPNAVAHTTNASWQGSGWLIPSDYHQAIEQHAVLLKRGQQQPAAIALINFLQQTSTQALIRQYGYDLPDSAAAQPQTYADRR